MATTYPEHRNVVIGHDCFRKLHRIGPWNDRRWEIVLEVHGQPVRFEGDCHRDLMTQVHAFLVEFEKLEEAML